MMEKRVATRNIWVFLIMTYGISWLFWVPSAIFGHDFQSSLWLIPFALGGFGPSAAGIMMTFREKDDAGTRRFWKRVIDIQRISGPWYVFIVLVFPTTLAIAALFYYLIRGQLPRFDVLNQFLTTPLALIGAVIVGLITGPLSEELGWRGYMQDQLQKQWSPLLSSLILAPIWWGWHLPLFFMSGTTQYTWGVGTIHFWLFLAGTFPLSILLAWVYNRNDHSTLAAILLHFMANFTLSLAHPISELLHFLYVLLLLIAGLGTAKMFGWGKRGMGGRADDQVE